MALSGFSGHSQDQIIWNDDDGDHGGDGDQEEEDDEDDEDEEDDDDDHLSTSQMTLVLHSFA